MRTQTPEELRHKHVDSDRSGMRAARHHIVYHRCNRAVIPGHEKAGNRHPSENHPLLVGLNGNDQKGGRKQERDRNGQQPSVVQALLKRVRDGTAHKHA